MKSQVKDYLLSLNIAHLNEELANKRALTIPRKYTKENLNDIFREFDAVIELQRELLKIQYKRSKELWTRGKKKHRISHFNKKRPFLKVPDFNSLFIQSPEDFADLRIRDFKNIFARNFIRFSIRNGIENYQEILTANGFEVTALDKQAFERYSELDKWKMSGKSNKE